MAGSDACFSIFSYIASASGCGIVAIIHIRIVIYACNRAIPSMTTARVHDDFRQQPGERDKAQPCEHDDGMPVLASTAELSVNEIASMMTVTRYARNTPSCRRQGGC